jgi:branched-chain amino acid aminotransferase
MVLLNQWGRVAEATVACIVMVRDGTVYTPPATEGSLESITLDLIEDLATSSGIPFVRRPIDRTELLIADEVGVCGTLTELTVASSIEGLPLSAESPILNSLQRRYLDAVRGIHPHPAIDLSIMPTLAASSPEPIRSKSY